MVGKASSDRTQPGTSRAMGRRRGSTLPWLLAQAFLVPFVSASSSCSGVAAEMPYPASPESSAAHRGEEVEQDSAALLQNIPLRRTPVAEPELARVSGEPSFEFGTPPAVDSAAVSSSGEPRAALDPQVWADWTAALLDNIQPHGQEQHRAAPRRRQQRKGPASLLDLGASMVHYTRHGEQAIPLKPFLVVASVFMLCFFATYQACTVPIFERKKSKGSCAEVLKQPQDLEARIRAAATPARDRASLASAASLQSARPGSLPVGLPSKSSKGALAARQYAAGEVYGALFQPAPQGRMSSHHLPSGPSPFRPAPLATEESQRCFPPSLPSAPFAPTPSRTPVRS